MAILFSNLWVNHPAIKGEISPCTTNGVTNFSNQCAIRMGVCFENAGISLATFNGAKCYPGHGHDQAHILRAEELASWIESQKILFGAPTKNKNVKSSDFKKKGIVLFKNFWGAGNQGDHIDLWNGAVMTRGAPSYFYSSQEVWFWELT
jgi:hypothetical protein